MRLIDADELKEHAWRDKLDSRELIAKMIDNAPTVKEIEIPIKIPISIYEQLVSKDKAGEKSAEQEHCEDAISRQEVLKYFEGWKNQIKYYHPYAKNFDIPYEEAIQRIKDVPPVKCVSSEKSNKCDDVISRQAVLDATVNKNSIWNNITNAKGENLEEIISQLPPVSSLEKSNKWIGAEVLKSIRLDIASQIIPKSSDEYGDEAKWLNMGLRMALKVIDKYKAESEE